MATRGRLPGRCPPGPAATRSGAPTAARYCATYCATSAWRVHAKAGYPLEVDLGSEALEDGPRRLDLEHERMYPIKRGMAKALDRCKEFTLGSRVARLSRPNYALRPPGGGLTRFVEKPSVWMRSLRRGKSGLLGGGTVR
jgi:hypothetical protein